MSKGRSFVLGLIAGQSLIVYTRWKNRRDNVVWRDNVWRNKVSLGVCENQLFWLSSLVIYLIVGKRRWFVPNCWPNCTRKNALRLLPVNEPGTNKHIFSINLAQIPSSIPSMLFFSDSYSVSNAISVQPYIPYPNLPILFEKFHFQLFPDGTV